MATRKSKAVNDPITVEVIRHKLDSIAKEMESTLFRSAFSQIVKEARDASASLFTVNGETLAQAIAIPNHLATLIPMVRKLLETYPLETLEEGDALILNDPYAGGTHLPDIAVVMPIFSKGKPIAISAAITHHQDVGGMTPGSVPTNATDIFQEGIRIPPLKFFEKGKVNETLVAMLRQNVRIPDMFMGDLNAEVAACSIGARRIRELAEEYGNDFAMKVFDTLLDNSERMTRAALRALPDGVYRNFDFVDNDGVEFDKSIRVEVAVTIKGDTMVCDFEGTSPQVRGPFNCMPTGPWSAACFAIHAIAGSDIPTNGGCFRPLSFKLPKGSLVNPVEPAPVGCRHTTIKRIATTILGALRQAAPDRVPADGAGELLLLSFGGKRSDGGNYLTAQILIGGTGASAGTDGVDVLDTDISNCRNVPAESMEMESPIRVHSMALYRDSGGPGKFRGGLGCHQEYELLEGESTVTHRGERFIGGPVGAEGGLAGGKSTGFIRRIDGTVVQIRSNEVVTMCKGDRLVVDTAGGGGWGDPKERDRELVAADLRNGKISADAARDIYGLDSSGAVSAPRKGRRGHKVETL
jgi:N-methylhydantoinase B